MKRSSIMALVLALLVAPAGFGASSVLAQGDSGTAESAPEPKTPEGEGDTDSGAAGAEDGAQSEGGSDATGESGDAAGESAEGSKPEGEAATGVEASEGEAGAETRGGGEAEEKTGPGGRPLREDYPGTDEAMKSRMETDRIEGVDLDQIEEPEEVYDLRIKELETKIDDLKEKVFRSKSRIVLLKETLLGGKLAGSQAVIRVKNDLGSFYSLERALVSLDGANIFNQRNRDGSLADKDEFMLYNDSIAPGNHKVTILMKVEGKGGVFSYFDEYKFTLRNSCPLVVEEGRASIMTLTLAEKGGALARHEERPAVSCKVEVADLKRAEEMEEDKEGSEEQVESEASEE
jgi:hypothetical protein